jgi:hypothetical protein
MRQIVATRGDNLSGPAAPHRHRHAGNPEVVNETFIAIVSVLRVWRSACARLAFPGTDTFGLWHASGYQKRSKL